MYAKGSSSKEGLGSWHFGVHDDAQILPMEPSGLARRSSQLSGSIKRCGIRLACDCMQKPFRLGKREKKVFLWEAGRFAYFPPIERYLRAAKEREEESSAPSP